MRQDITIDHGIARRLCSAMGVSFAAAMVGHKRRTGRQPWENTGRQMFAAETPRIWFHLLARQIESMTGGRKRVNDRSLFELYKNDPQYSPRK